MTGFIEKFNLLTISGWVNLDEAPFYILDVERKVELIPNKVRSDFGGSKNGFEYSPSQLGLELSNDSPYKLIIVNNRGKEILNSPCMIETRPSELNKVYAGLDGWLFLVNDSNDSMAYSYGEKILPDDVVVKWSQIIKSRSIFCKDNLTSYFHLVAPSKETIYSKYIKRQEDISDCRPIFRILEKDIEKSVLYPSFSDVLGESYYKGDSHWNYYGAYSAYTLYMKSLGLEPISIELCNKSISYMKGDLITKISNGVNVEKVEHFSIEGSLEHKVYDNGVVNTGRIQEYINNDASGSILIFHSSSIDWMKPFLVKSFRKSKFIWNINFDTNEVKGFKPDHVLTQTNERFLVRYPDS
jgi:alginate O-acetyltransferase complex protein AlgJ